jgi:hypothetical protein
VKGPWAKVRGKAGLERMCAPKAPVVPMTPLTLTVRPKRESKEPFGRGIVKRAKKVAIRAILVTLEVVVVGW